MISSHLVSPLMANNVRLCSRTVPDAIFDIILHFLLVVENGAPSFQNLLELREVSKAFSTSILVFKNGLVLNNKRILRLGKKFADIESLIRRNGRGNASNERSPLVVNTSNRQEHFLFNANIREIINYFFNNWHEVEWKLMSNEPLAAEIFTNINKMVSELRENHITDPVYTEEYQNMYQKIKKIATFLKKFHISSKTKGLSDIIGIIVAILAGGGILALIPLLQCLIFFSVMHKKVNIPFLIATITDIILICAFYCCVLNCYLSECYSNCNKDEIAYKLITKLTNSGRVYHNRLKENIRKEIRRILQYIPNGNFPNHLFDFK